MLFLFGKCLDFCGSNIICPQSLLGWIVQIKTLKGKLLLSIFEYVGGGNRGVEWSLLSKLIVNFLIGAKLWCTFCSFVCRIRSHDLQTSNNYKFLGPMSRVFGWLLGLTWVGILLFSLENLVRSVSKSWSQFLVEEKHEWIAQVLDYHCYHLAGT